MKIDREEEKFKIDALNDMRALIKDLDDVQRIALTGKKSSLLKWSDLPSQRENAPEMNVEVRKAFLQNLSKKYADNK